MSYLHSTSPSLVLSKGFRAGLFSGIALDGRPVRDDVANVSMPNTATSSSLTALFLFGVPPRHCSVLGRGHRCTIWTDLL